MCSETSGDTFQNIAVNDTTPSVYMRRKFKTANSSGTAITDFDDGYLGQTIELRVLDANTSIVNGASIKTATGANITCVNGLMYRFQNCPGDVWVQI